MRADPGALNPLQHPEVLLDGATETFSGPVPGTTLSIRDRLRQRSTPVDQTSAYELLEQSSDPAARGLAALVASNFAEEDRTWHALVRSMLAGPDFGAGAASMVLRALAKAGRFTVDWSDAEEALAAILGGTNLFAYGAVLTSLVETGIDADLARRLASRNPYLLLDHAMAKNRMAAEPAGRFLAHIGAPDRGQGRQAVLDWLGEGR